MFLYQVRTSSFDTFGFPRLLSTGTPSESITRKVGIPGLSAGLMNFMSVVNLLLTAPGKRTLVASQRYILGFLVYCRDAPIRPRALRDGRAPSHGGSGHSGRIEGPPAAEGQ